MSCVICNNGTIKLNQPLTAEAIEAFRKELRDNQLSEENHFPLIQAMIAGESTIDIEEYYDREFDGTCHHLVNALMPLGYELDARIAYNGDYDGCTFITKNVIDEKDISDCWQYDASDEDIIAALERRGYDMTSAKKQLRSKNLVREAFDRALGKTVDQKG